MDDLNTVEGSPRPGHAGWLAGPLRSVLLESRQRWRDMVALAADIAFETDARGCLTFVMPDPMLGWRAGALLGEPAETLLVEAASAAAGNPLAPTCVVRRQRVWLRRGDGGAACVLLSAAPLLDRHGKVVGARGIGTDITEQDGRDARIAASLRRGEVIDHILWRMRQEVMAPRMMRAALEAMANALGAEGAAVLSLVDGAPSLLHETGTGAQAALAASGALLEEADPRGTALARTDPQPILAASCRTRFGDLAGVALWRPAGGRAWDQDDLSLAGSAASIVRVVLEHEAIQREMASQALTDPLTGLLNRRAFLAELPRHIGRLDREGLPGTLIFADFDNFKPVNDRLGHDVGDQLLRHGAELLRRTFRPTDLVARLGGDEFAVWLNGADHMTAAERAEQLRVEAPRTFADLAGDVGHVAFSIGIATRQPGSGEEIEELMRRADLAMYEVKRAGRGHWRVSHLNAA
ncbi:MAG: sensor domain-containing diguanylate cyclase [Acetobacteraceae bacterium]|nr:sensor domain-containing diguanylate cyclase [Acetobacteraceae bacterium]